MIYDLWLTWKAFYDCSKIWRRRWGIKSQRNWIGGWRVIKQATNCLLAISTVTYVCQKNGYEETFENPSTMLGQYEDIEPKNDECLLN